VHLELIYFMIVAGDGKSFICVRTSPKPMKGMPFDSIQKCILEFYFHVDAYFSMVVKVLLYHSEMYSRVLFLCRCIFFYGW
jgi:hypothetical protein